MINTLKITIFLILLSSCGNKEVIDSSSDTARPLEIENTWFHIDNNPFRQDSDNACYMLDDIDQSLRERFGDEGFPLIIDFWNVLDDEYFFIRYEVELRITEVNEDYIIIRLKRGLLNQKFTLTPC